MKLATLAWILGILAAFGLGGFIGGAITALTALKLADRGDEQTETDDVDEQDELDAHAVRDLVHASTRIYNDAAAGYVLRADHRNQLGEALEGCEQLRDWIDYYDVDPADEDGATV